MEKQDLHRLPWLPWRFHLAQPPENTDVKQGVVAYSCPFVPAEWLAAHGLHPRRMVPHANGTATGMGERMGVCPYARAFAGAVLPEAGVQAVVMTTVCDQMRRMAETLARESNAPVFLMHVPKTWETPAVHRYFRDELGRLGRFLVRLGGTAPDRNALIDTMLRYDAARAALAGARGHLTSRQWAAALMAFFRDGPDAQIPGKRDTPARGIPLALVGGPGLSDGAALLDAIEAGGGTVVLDASAQGERTFPAPFDRRRLHDDPLGELVDAYFGYIPDAFRRPNSALYAYLKREIGDRGVKGIIFRRCVWCDTWHAEMQRMKEWAEIPMLVLEADDSGESQPRALSRIQAFLENLR
jgi:benzoyl-CoA reductase/2-hydroxyglutaryl-CoA dehydratase subunit BcrC/BadD/HgdB